MALFLHGRHARCDNDGAGPGLVSPPILDDCVQANRIPSHEGYNYIMERLASQGIVSISISAHDIQPGLGIWDYDARGRMLLHQRVEHHRQRAVEHRVGRPDRQVERALAIADDRAHRRQFSEQDPRAVGQPVSALGRAYGAAGATQQGHPEVALEHAHLLGHRGRGQIQAPRRFRHRPRLEHHHDGAQIVGLHEERFSFI